MIDHFKLLNAIDADLKVCRSAADTLHPTDIKGKERNVLELATLIAHKQWAERAGSDQAELEKVVCSLETNHLLRSYRHWREACEIKSCPAHNEPMRFPTSLRLESGKVIENLYYCPVQDCTWRYLEGTGYKKATEF